MVHVFKRYLTLLSYVIFFLGGITSVKAKGKTVGTCISLAL